MRIYISAAREQKELAAEYARVLRVHKHEIADGWFDDDLPPNDSYTLPSDQNRIAIRQQNAILNCDLLLYLSPPLNSGRGCHIELGIAYGSNTQVAVVHDECLSNFERLAHECYPTFDHFISALESGRFDE